MAKAKTIRLDVDTRAMQRLLDVLDSMRLTRQRMRAGALGPDHCEIRRWSEEIAAALAGQADPEVPEKVFRCSRCGAVLDSEPSHALATCDRCIGDSVGPARRGGHNG